MNQTVNSSLNLKWYSYLLGYSPFLLIALGLNGNLLTFFIIRTSSNLKKQSSMMIFSFVSIIDIFALFTWNLDIYFKIFYDYYYETENLITCRIMPFLQYFSKQTSAIMISFISIDRYLTIISKPGSFVSRLPFGNPRYSFIWSCCITLVIFILNSHILILNGYLSIDKKSNKSSSNINCYSYPTGYKLVPDWNMIDIIIYSILPFLIMILFNSLIIIKTLHLNKKFTNNRNSNQNARAFYKKRHLTITLLVITFLFLFLTLPNSIHFLIFYNNDQHSFYLGSFLDFLMFLHHSTLFLVLLTNTHFRKALFDLKNIYFKK